MELLFEGEELKKSISKNVHVTDKRVMVYNHHPFSKELTDIGLVFVESIRFHSRRHPLVLLIGLVSLAASVHYVRVRSDLSGPLLALIGIASIVIFYVWKTDRIFFVGANSKISTKGSMEDVKMARELIEELRHNE